ncbi:response regulator [Kamptonema formosum]|uniref:response regulator n=1 Tax=Kamptonema formosum TaxID=331992 RepID=UPI00034CD1BD|nr:response regulator [Oscillatoria sp. PCC 10802]
MSRCKAGFLANILVVDDDPNNLRLLTDVLSQRGYGVRPLLNGQLAIAAVRAEAPDLILLDIMMPAPDGYDVCSQLKADEKTRDIPVIFLSALYEPFDKVKAFSTGGYDYITKPFQVEELLARIENQLKIGRLQKHLREQNEQLQEEIRNRQLMEDKLRSSQEEIRGFFEAMADIVLMIDAGGHTVKVAPTNPGKLYPPGTDIIAKTVDMFFGEREKFCRYIRQALEAQQVVNCEYSLQLEGERLWFSASIAPTSENTVAWVARDISERKKAEEALRESAEREKTLSAVIQKMRQSLNLETIFAATTSELRQVLNCDRVLVYQFNPDWSGSCAAESVGSEWTPVMRHDCSFCQLINKDSCALKDLSNSSGFVRDTYLVETQGGVYNRGIHYLAIENIYEAGFTSCYIELLERLQAKAYVAVPIFCGEKLWGLLAAYQNRSSRQWKKTEISTAVHIGNQLGIALQQAELLAQTQRQSEALQDAVLAADAANRAKSEFLASMSHELRTPLNAILGFSQIMSRDSSISAENQKNLEIINRAGEHLLCLIDDILEVSKIEAGRTTFNESSFDLLQLLDSLEKMLHLKAASKGLQLRFEYGAVIPQYVKTDGGKLRQVLLNLLGNAIKFTQVGWVTLRVSLGGQLPAEEKTELTELTAESDKFTLHFEVEDTGPGIAPEEFHLLFEAFAQTEAGRKSQQGTGLGLPISQKYVHLMGGEIQVSSTPGQGSLFAFDIQIRAAGAEEVEIVQPSRKVIRLAPAQPEYRILVADDIANNRLLLVKILASIGFSIREATNGQEVVQCWKDWQPHLILMDMRMPVMDGYEATRLLRAEERQRGELQLPAGAERDSESSRMPADAKTIIFALTASAFDEQRQIILSAGCDYFLSKPFQPNVLLEKISQALGVQYEWEQESEAAEQNKAPADKLTASDLRNLISEMPPEWVAQVSDAASEGSDDRVVELLEQIPAEKAALAGALRDLAENFQFGEIISLTGAE